LSSERRLGPLARPPARDTLRTPGAMASSAGRRRLLRELAQLEAQGVSPTVHVAPHSDDMSTIDALVIGPEETPYDGAMIHLRLKVTDEYPLKPPQIKIISTDSGNLRIHPQLYADGKVCLSILGTWHGPRWSTNITLRTLLLSIQSLLTEEPLRCEPGLEEVPQEAVDRANVFFAHEAARVLILGQLTSGGPTWGTGEDAAPLTAAMHRHLAERRAPILKRLQELAAKHDGQMIRDPLAHSFSAGRRCNFADIIEKLTTLHAAMAPSSASSSSSSPSAPAAFASSEPADVAATSALPSPPPGKAPKAKAKGKEKAKAGEGQNGSGAPEVGKPKAQTKAKAKTQVNPPGKALAKGTSASVDEDASGDVSDGGLPHCRICHMDAEESEEPLIAPCRCSGSMRYAHSGCVLDWLRRSPVALASTTWRCDVCRAKYVVKLGGGKTRGYSFFLRDIGIFAPEQDEEEFECPGYISVLCVSILQMLLSTISRVASETLVSAARFISFSAMPSAVGERLLMVLCVPALILEVVGMSGYIVLCCGKFVIMSSGPEWHPQDWGDFGVDFVELVLEQMTSFLAFSFGVRMDVFIFVMMWICASHFCSMMTSTALPLWAISKVTGSNLSWFRSDITNLSAHPGMSALFPQGWHENVEFVNRVFLSFSLCVNLLAIMRLFQAAFLLRCPEPLDVLPRPPEKAKKAKKKEDVGAPRKPKDTLKDK